MDANDRFINRKFVRLQNYDYSTPNAYFLTLCTENKECILGNTGQMSGLGLLVQEELEKIPLHHPEVILEKYVVMPNHIHAIIRLDGSVEKRMDIIQLVALYKAAVSRKAQRRIWQRSFYEHVIRNQTQYDRIWEYIENNPAKWELDCFYR